MIVEDEWEEVGKWVWENRDTFNGLSFLPYDGGSYKQAPFETIDEEEYNRLSENLHEVDLSMIIEVDDNTNLSGELACSGTNGCEIL